LVGNEELPVREEVAYATPFGTLLRFGKDVTRRAAARAAGRTRSPGTSATLLRNTVKTMRAEHDV